MQDIFVESQWDTLWTFLQQGSPALWVLLAAVNGAFLVFWLYAKIIKDRPLRPATIGFLRVLFVLANTAIVFRDQTVNIIRSSVDYMPFLDHLM
jgi:hypothetical protein